MAATVDDDFRERAAGQRRAKQLSYAIPEKE